MPKYNDFELDVQNESPTDNLQLSLSMHRTCKMTDADMCHSMEIILCKPATEVACY